jgi:hypothetical protein
MDQLLFVYQPFGEKQMNDEMRKSAQFKLQ